MNRGFNRPGGPPRGAAARGSYALAARANRGTAHSFNQARAQRGGRSAAGRAGMGGGRSSGGERRGGGGRR
jgi:hypothetical protein